MTIGAGTYVPWGRFTFPRSYIAKVYIATAGFTLSQNFGEFTLDFRPTFTSVYHFTFAPDWWVWTSNVYTMDHIITECYYQDPPDPRQFPLNFTLSWKRDTLSAAPYLLFAPNGNPANPVQAAFTANGFGYWTRPT